MTAPHLQLVDDLIAAAPAGNLATATKPLLYACTHFGNRDRFVEKHGDDVRYDPSRGGWFCYDGMRFAFDATGTVAQLAQAIIRDVRREAIACTDASIQKRLFRWADKCETASGAAQILELAKTDPRISRTPDDWDTNPDLLNAVNGTINLRTGALQPHSRDDAITRRIPVMYDPDACCSRWESFLEQVVPDPAVRGMLRVAVGYSLTGHTSEQVLLMLLGPGGNGKGMLLNTLLALAGDYGGSADFDTFLERPAAGGSARGDIARLHNLRFVTTSEAGEGKWLNEAMIKSLTGQDKITARRLYAPEFEFRPLLTLWMMANHRPVIRGTDDGIWRRIVLVPFTVRIPKEQQDKELDSKLLAELPGILAWAVSGAIQWYREGLRLPDAVLTATDTYRDESDAFADFITDVCEQRPMDERTVASELFLAYQRWCESRGERGLTSNAFGRKLTDRGFTGAKVGGDRVRFGIRIRLAYLRASEVA